MPPGTSILFGSPRVITARRKEAPKLQAVRQQHLNPEMNCSDIRLIGLDCRLCHFHVMVVTANLLLQPCTIPSIQYSTSTSSSGTSTPAHEEPNDDGEVWLAAPGLAVALLALILTLDERVASLAAAKRLVNCVGGCTAEVQVLKSSQRQRCNREKKKRKAKKERGE